MVTLSSLLFGAAVGFSAPAPQSAQPPGASPATAPQPQPVVQIVIETAPAEKPAPIADPFRSRRPDHPRAHASKQAKARRAEREAKLLDPFAQPNLVAHEARPQKRGAMRDPFGAKPAGEAKAVRRTPSPRGQPFPKRSDEGLIDPFAAG